MMPAYNHNRERLPWEDLSPREAEVARWSARGYSTSDVATILSVEPKTVESHINVVYSKLGLYNGKKAASLAYFAMRDGFVTDKPPGGG